KQIESKNRGTRTVVELPHRSVASGVQGAAADDPDADSDPYATAEDELKAIGREKTGQDIPEKELIWIKERLELQASALEDFVAEVRKHTRNHWKNPIG